MASIYARGNRLWGAIGKGKARRSIRTDFVVGQEEEARAAAELVEKKIANGVLQAADLGPLTVAGYAKRWIAERRARGVGSVDHDEVRIERYITPRLGSMKVADVRPRHVRDLVRELGLRCGSADDQLAPRTVRHIYATLRTMFNDATADEVVAATPCVLKRGDLPKKIDKDPTWRAQAAFTREEVEQLISDERVPEDRRVYYAVIFLTGMRPDEALVRRWRDYEPEVEPLGKLLVASAWDRGRKVEKAVKTERPREVPVHQTLARVLATWRLHGWRLMLGQPARPDDFTIPSRQGKVRNISATLKRFHEDLDRLGMRRRRQYDARRTLVSLARGDGASKDILRWATHGPTGDIVDAYTSMPWAALCGEIAKLRIGLREGKVLPLRQTGAVSSSAATSAATDAARQNETPASAVACGGSKWRGVGDSNPWPPA